MKAFQILIFICFFIAIALQGTIGNPLNKRAAAKCWLGGEEAEGKEME